MVAKRIIPCLDVKDGQVVKGINFLGLKEVGDAVGMGRRYSEEGADELVYLDISATYEGRRTFVDLVSRIAMEINIPFTVGGGISSLEDAARLLDAGADKVSLNSAAIADPALISRIADHYGSQFVVVAIDARCVGMAGQAGHDRSNVTPGSDNRNVIPGSTGDLWMATTHGGRVQTDRELFSWAREAQERGAGEILFTSMDHDGTKAGYALRRTVHPGHRFRRRGLHGPHRGRTDPGESGRRARGQHLPLWRDPHSGPEARARCSRDSGPVIKYVLI